MRKETEEVSKDPFGEEYLVQGSGIKRK